MNYWSSGLAVWSMLHNIFKEFKTLNWIFESLFHSILFFCFLNANFFSLHFLLSSPTLSPLLLPIIFDRKDPEEYFWVYLMKEGGLEEIKWQKTTSTPTIRKCGEKERGWIAISSKSAEKREFFFFSINKFNEKINKKWSIFDQNLTDFMNFFS